MTENGICINVIYGGDVDINLDQSSDWKALFGVYTKAPRYCSE
jgi:uncharacterized protein YegJ (DUF2314 family)